MYYYLVEKMGDGTRENPFRPNYEGDYVWSDSGCPNCSTYIIALPTETELLQPIVDLKTACYVRNISFNDVTAWFAGD